MTFAGRIEPYSASLPRTTFQWDADTEILSAQLEGVSEPRGYTGVIELEDPRGAILTLDVRGGTLAAFEVVVWPDVREVEGLRAPAHAAPARLVVPPRPSQPGIAATEVELAISGERTPDESVLHFRIGGKRATTAHQLANHLIIEMDRADEPAGFWLTNVPPYPRAAGTR